MDLVLVGQTLYLMAVFTEKRRGTREEYQMNYIQSLVDTRMCLKDVRAKFGYNQYSHTVGI